MERIIRTLRPSEGPNITRHVELPLGADTPRPRIIRSEEVSPKKLQMTLIPGFNNPDVSISAAAREPSTPLIKGAPGEMRARLVIAGPGEINKRTQNESSALVVLEGRGKMVFEDGTDLMLEPGQVVYAKDKPYELHPDEAMAIYQVAFGDNERDLGLIVPGSEGLIVGSPGQLQVARFAELDERQLNFFPPITQMLNSDGVGLELTKRGFHGTDSVFFEAGANVDTHEHPGAHILLVLEAEKGTILEYDGDEYPLLPGTVYYVDDNTPHAIYNRSGKNLVLFVAGNGHYGLDHPLRMTPLEKRGRKTLLDRFGEPLSRLREKTAA